MLKHVFVSLLLTLSAACAWGVDLAQVRFHNEASDTTRINDMLVTVAGQRLANPGKRVSAIGRMLLGTPYVGHTLEGEPEMLTVNVDELDCTTFVETAIAMAVTLGENRTSWLDYIYNLERLRYRNGTVAGYPSRLHYIADWAVDNMHRGTLQDVTTHFPRYTYMVKTIDFMSSNADKYAALADSANLAGIRNVEIGYRSHRFPYIKTIDLGNKQVKADFQEGDILAFVSNIKNLDVTHMGLVVIEGGEPHVMHASSSEGKVVVSSLPLADFMKRNRQFVGVRVFRVND